MMLLSNKVRYVCRGGGGGRCGEGTLASPAGLVGAAHAGDASVPSPHQPPPPPLRNVGDLDR
jgi:hypothetical protein